MYQGRSPRQQKNNENIAGIFVCLLIIVVLLAFIFKILNSL
jgi:hypothetical protein